MLNNQRIKFYFGIRLLLLSIFAITKIKSECVSLSTSTFCPAFSSYSIDTVNGAHPMKVSSTHYTDVASFDAYAEKYASFLSDYFLKELIKGSTCNESEVLAYGKSTLRYLKTYSCNYLLKSNSQAACITNAPVVCSTICNEFNASLESIVTKYNSCLNPTTVSTRLTYHKNICSANVSFNGTGNTCIGEAKLTNESTFCGFLTLDDACTYCKSNTSSLACCTSLSCIQGQTPTQQQPTTPVTNTSKTTVANNNANKLDKENDEKEDSSGISIWWYIGIFLIFLLAAFLIYFYKKGQDDEDSESEEEKKKNE